MRTGWGRGIDEEQEGTVKKEKGRDTGFVMTVSSPMAGKMCVHMLQ